MEKLVCDICGGKLIAQSGGVFVCDSCGMEYSKDRIKEMVQEIQGTVKVEGSVDVSGSTVTIDNQKKLENLYSIARRAKKDNNIESAAKYYDLIMQEDPNSWEALFYATYYSAMQTNIAGISSAAYKVSNTVDSTLYLIKNNVDFADQLSAVSDIYYNLDVLAGMLSNAAIKSYNEISSDIRDQYSREFGMRMISICKMLYTFGDKIEIIFVGNKEMHEIALCAWKSGVAINKCEFYNLERSRLLDLYNNKISQNDVDYKKKNIIDNLKKQKKEIESNINRLNKELVDYERNHSINITGYTFIKVLLVISGLLAIIGLFSLGSTSGIGFLVGGITGAILSLFILLMLKATVVESGKSVEKCKSSILSEKERLNTINKKIDQALKMKKDMYVDEKDSESKKISAEKLMLIADENHEVYFFLTRISDKLMKKYFEGEDFILSDYESVLNDHRKEIQEYLIENQISK